MSQKTFEFEFLGDTHEAAISKSTRTDLDEFHIFPTSDNMFETYGMLIVQLREDGRPSWNMPNAPRGSEYALAVWHGLQKAFPETFHYGLV